MEPDDLPILSAGVRPQAAGMETQQSRQITAEATASLASAGEHFRVLASDAASAASDAEVRMNGSWTGSIGEVAARALKAASTASKKVDAVVDGFGAAANDYLQAARIGLRAEGARPVLLLDEQAAANALDLHEDHAIETIVAPFVSAQVQAAASAVHGAPIPIAQIEEYHCLPGQLPLVTILPDGTTSGELTCQYPPGTKPLPTVPTPSSPPYVPPPPPTSPPPYPVPMPPGGACCEPPTIIVNCPAPPTSPTVPPTSPTVPKPTPKPTPKPGEEPVEEPVEEPAKPKLPELPLPPIKSVNLPSIPSPDWDNADPCAVALSYERSTAILSQPSGSYPDQGGDLVGALTALARNYLVGPVGAGTLTSSLFSGAWDIGLDLFHKSIAAVSGQVGFNIPVVLESIGALSLSGWAERLAGAPVTRLTKNLEYALQFETAYELPSQADFNDIYYSGAITREQWVCYTRALGHAPNTHGAALDAGRTKPNLGDIVQLYYRGKLNLDSYLQQARQRGVTEAAEAIAFLQLGEYIPASGDITRFMTRDVEDREAVIEGALDTDFDDKYKGILESWGTANGITRDVMLRYWRAHWELPSNTEIYEFVRRLRPGRVDPGLEFTKKDAAKLLRVNDHAPGFIDRLIEISYHPINRTDVEAAFISGAMAEAEVLERYLDLGYSPTDAKQLQFASKIKKESQIQQSAGIWTKRRINREYIGGGLQRADAFKLLTDTIPDAATANRLLDSADILRAVQARNKCIAGIKRRYFVGAITRIEARNNLQDLEMDRLQVDVLIQGWTCERENRAKEPTIKLLSEWAREGIISAIEMHRRLINLGYIQMDADAIITALGIEIDITRNKAEVKSAREAMAEARRQKAEARQRRLDQQREADRAKKEEKERAKANEPPKKKKP